jgi:hypothetical protein
MKSVLDLRPAYHRLGERIRARSHGMEVGRQGHLARIG